MVSFLHVCHLHLVADYARKQKFNENVMSFLELKAFLLPQNLVEARQEYNSRANFILYILCISKLNLVVPLLKFSKLIPAVIYLLNMLLQHLGSVNK